MSSLTRKFLLAVSLAAVPALALAQDRAVPRGSGGGGGDAGGRHVSPSGGGSGSSHSGGGYDSSSAGSQTYSAPRSNAERRHPRAGSGSGGAYYPGYHPGYYPGYPGYGSGWYYPGYGGYWWPYGYYGWYGAGYWGYPGYFGGGGGAVYYSNREREGASLRVLVDPSEARVYVDGYYAGVVDDFDGLLQRLHVSPGRHEITLKLEGYKSHRARVYVGPDATLKLHHEMQKGSGETFEDLSGGAPPPEREIRRESEDVEVDEEEDPVAASGETARLELTVEPPDASVYVDGAFRGSGREASSLRLAPGRHRIEVVRPGYRTAENEIDVPAGETTKIRVTLDRPSI